MSEMVADRQQSYEETKVVGRPGPSVKNLFDADTRPVSDLLRNDRNDFAEEPGDQIAVDRYISRDFHDLEVERMWSRVWQVACHEDQIPKVGDYVVYEIANKSIIVVRTAADTVKAYFNACLHRGRQLCEKDGHTPTFRCPFHGFMWKLDGRLSYVPSKWDFPDLKEEEFRLPEAKVGIWSRFVFINLDPEAEPFEKFLGTLPDHFTNWRLENRHVVAHIGQVVRANWKVATEAFLEFFHGMATHPQAMPGTSEAATRYVARKGQNFGFMVSPTAVPSPYVANRVNEQDILDSILLSKNATEKGTVKLPEGVKARAYYAELTRQELTQSTGQDYSGVSDSEMVDLLVYSIFPNTTIFGGFGLPFWYRFRPYQNDPEMSFMEIFVFVEKAPDAPREPVPPMTLLGPDQSFTDSPELTAMRLGEFFNQDLGNMEWVQKGLHTIPSKKITISRYQESEIRQLHALIDDYISGAAPAR